MPGTDDPDSPDPDRAASTPDEAARRAEEALARIEALADVDDVDAGGDAGNGADRDAGSQDADTRGQGASTSQPGAPTEPKGPAGPEGRGDPTAGSRSARASTSGGDPADAGSQLGQCQNCGALLEGPYCSQCGQKAAERVVPLWHLLNEALEAVFELDLRVLHTLPRFLFVPGQLTEEYIEGRRRRYIRPFRLYLLATFLLFTTLALLRPGGITAVFNPDEPLQRNEADASALREQALDPGSQGRAGLAGLSPGLPSDLARPGSARPDSARRGAVPPPAGSTATGIVAAADSAAAGAPRSDSVAGRVSEILADGQVDVGELEQMEAAGNDADLSDPTVRRQFAQMIRDSLEVPPLTDDPETNARIEYLLSTKGARAITNPGEFLAGVTDRIPYMMFLLLPLFAVLLKLLYMRRGRLYMEHFIFTLHIHALAFFAFTAGILMNESSVPFINTAGEWVMASPILYLIVAMQRIYRQGFLKTTVKAGFLLSAYSIVLATGFAVLGLLTVVLM